VVFNLLKNSLSRLTTFALLCCSQTLLAQNECSINDVMSQTRSSVWLEVIQEQPAASGGSVLNVGCGDADFKNLDVVALSYFQVDHSTSLQLSYFGENSHDLPLACPTKNQLIPSATEFVEARYIKPQAAFYDLRDTAVLLEKDDGKRSYRF